MPLRKSRKSANFTPSSRSFEDSGLGHREDAVRSLGAVLIILMGGAISMDAWAGVDIKHDEFLFSLGGDWRQVQSRDPEQFSFESKEKKTSVVLSVMGSLNIPKQRLTEVAAKFAEVRRDAEQKARGKSLQFGDRWVELKPSGDVAEVAYAGFDPSGTVFRFFGFVTQRKLLSFWVATTTRDNEFSKQVFDEVFKGLKFYVP